MPKRILLIGVLSCIVGLLAIWSLFEHASLSTFYFNLNVILLPIGIGLLYGKQRARWWARVYIILSYLILGVSAVLFLMHHQKLEIEAGDLPFAMSETLLGALLSLCFMIYLALLIGVHKLLFSEKANRYFLSRVTTPETRQAAAEFARELARQRRLYRKFLAEDESRDLLSSKVRHERFRDWLAAKEEPLPQEQEPDAQRYAPPAGWKP